MEEIAAQAEVSKPVVYEHFGGKEGLYAVVVDREVRTLLDGIGGSLTSGTERELIEQAALALLDYIESHTDGFRILARDSSVGSTGGSFATILGDIASQVEHILVGTFKTRGLDPKTAPDVRPDAGRHGRRSPVSGGSAPAGRRSPRWPPTWSTWPGTGSAGWRPSPGWSPLTLTRPRRRAESTRSFIGSPE